MIVSQKMKLELLCDQQLHFWVGNQTLKGHLRAEDLSQ